MFPSTLRRFGRLTHSPLCLKSSLATNRVTRHNIFNVHFPEATLEADIGKLEPSTLSKDASFVSFDAKIAIPKAKVESNEVASVTVDYKELHQINIKSGGSEHSLMTTFESTPFSPRIQRVLKNEGFTAPTPTQAQSWPIALAKRDIISVARTGSGKTCGFLLPALQQLIEEREKAMLESSPPPSSSSSSAATSSSGTRRAAARRMRVRPVPKVLILAPTRELSVQISSEAEKFASACGMRTACLYGGAGRFPQIKQLREGVDIVVATPGRCNDLAETGDLDLSDIKYLVLDEADRMLDMGFEPQIREILSGIPKEHQSLFFTATWPKEVQTLANEFLRDPVHIEIGDQDRLNANKAITQNIRVVRSVEKHNALLEILDEMKQNGEKSAEGEAGSNSNNNNNPQRSFPKTIIFRSRKSDCDELCDALRDEGYRADSLHGDKSQNLRDRVMENFRNGRIRIIVATDVAARGLDIKDIDTVINYDFPVGSSAVESYVHRIGRTARGNNTGTAHTLLTTADSPAAKELVDVLKRCGQQVPPSLMSLLPKASKPFPGGPRGGGYSRPRFQGNGFARREDGFSRGYNNYNNNDRAFTRGDFDRKSGGGASWKDSFGDRSRDRSGSSGMKWDRRNRGESEEESEGFRGGDGGSRGRGGERGSEYRRRFDGESGRHSSRSRGRDLETNSRRSPEEN